MLGIFRICLPNYDDCARPETRHCSSDRCVQERFCLGNGKSLVIASYLIMVLCFSVIISEIIYIEMCFNSWI